MCDISAMRIFGCCVMRQTAGRNRCKIHFKMIQSQFILDIFNLTFDDLEIGKNLRNQVSFLNENSREHTGVGLFINFSSENGIEKYKVATYKAENLDIYGNPTEMINGVEIKNEKLKILADATVHLTNGIIDGLEIWNKIGEEYPKSDPTQYELIQLWLELENMRTIIRN